MTVAPPPVKRKTRREERGLVVQMSDEQRRIALYGGPALRVGAVIVPSGVAGLEEAKSILFVPRLAWHDHSSNAIRHLTRASP